MSHTTCLDYTREWFYKFLCSELEEYFLQINLEINLFQINVTSELISQISQIK